MKQIQPVFYIYSATPIIEIPAWRLEQAIPKKPGKKRRKKRRKAKP